MKKTILSAIIATTLSFTAFGQAPEGFKYQAVVRDAGNTILNNQAVGVQLTIQQGSVGGTVVYTETFAPTTNAYGLINLEIGTGTTSDDFTIIDWANGPYFIETAVDVAGGTSYSVMGTAQLMSVPYALYAKTAGSTSGGGNWTLNGVNINNSNTGNVGVGISSAPQHTLAVGKTDSTSSLAVGYVGSFNNAQSGKLVFSEDLSFNGDCGLMFQLNGATNNLHLMGGCTTFNDTIARFNRSGFTNIKNLRLGATSLTTNSTNPLSVDGNSDFTGDMTITGNLTVTGNIAKGGGTFKIDHPLDPTNKYLVHSFVESPEMMNVFSGNITTDANGYATVTMPSYFEAANKDFRYQLTVMGSFAQAIIKEKVSNNKFVIQTNNPNVEVSWQVTSVRSDKYANANRVTPELEKELKGTYIHPELYGASVENSESARRAKIALDSQVEKVGADNQ
ncbi:MAG: hypothetical protein AB7O47_00200 [Flavobacteriales bacterium]